MPTIEPDVFARLSTYAPLTATGCTIAPQNARFDEPALPWLVYSITGAEPAAPEIDNSGELTRYTLAVAYAAQTYDGMVTVSEAVRTALDSYTGGQIVQSQWAGTDLGFDDDAGYFGGSSEFSILGASAAILPVSSGVPPVTVQPDGLYVGGVKVQTAITNLAHVAYTDVANTFTASPQTLVSGSTSAIPLICKGTVSQTADLLQCQNSTGTVGLSYTVNNFGQSTLTIDGAASGTGYANLYVKRGSSSVSAMTIYTTGGTANWFAGTLESETHYSLYSSSTGHAPLKVGYSTSDTRLSVKAASSGTADLTQWQDGTGSVLTRITSAGYLGIGTAPSYPLHVPGVSYLGGVLMSSGTWTNFNNSSWTLAQTGNYPVIVKGVAGQTADLLQCQNSTGTAFLRVGGKPTFNANGDTGLTLSVSTNLSSSGQTYAAQFTNTAGSGTAATVTGIVATCTQTATHNLAVANQAITNTSAGTTTTAQCYRAQMSATGTGIVSNWYGLSVQTAFVSGSGGVGTVYGVKIEDQNVGNTCYSIYTGKGRHRFGDGTSDTKVGFFGATPVTKPTALTPTSHDGTSSVDAAVIDNVRTRLEELESRLQALGLLA